LRLKPDPSGGTEGHVSEPRIRPAKPEDLPELVRIYNHYVTNTHITFDTKAFTVNQRRSWLDGFSQAGPHRLLVSELAQRPIGYASSSAFRLKPAYDQSVETTIYLDPDFTGRGIGKLLYAAILDLIRAEKCVHRAYGGVALPNPVSIALHERLGFRLVGTFREVGFKFGRYWNVSWYEKDLSDSHAA
jgi:phosphinothricin acetyltransferase